jgi:hypothetical protein
MALETNQRKLNRDDAKPFQLIRNTDPRRFKQLSSLENRLADEAQSLRESAKLLPAGPVREAAMRKAR